MYVNFLLLIKAGHQYLLSSHNTKSNPKFDTDGKVILHKFNLTMKKKAD